METKHILTTIFGFLIVAVLAFVVIWSVINFDKVKDGMSGTGVYTYEDIENAFEDGYNTALENKAEYLETIENLKEQLDKLSNSGTPESLPENNN